MSEYTDYAAESLDAPDLSEGTDATVVDIGSLADEGDAEKAPQAQGAQQGKPQPKQERMFAQAELDNLIQRRLASERNKPAYRIGKEALANAMNGNDKMTEAEAEALIRKQRIKQRVDSYKGDTSKFMEDVLLEQERRQSGQTEPDGNEGDGTRALSQQLAQERASGAIPEDFDLLGTLKDPSRRNSFLADREKFGAAAAVELSRRAAQTAPQVQKPNLPKPIKANDNGYKANKVDFSEMSTEEFRKFEAKIKRAAASGKEVRF